MGTPHPLRSYGHCVIVRACAFPPHLPCDPVFKFVVFSESRPIIPHQRHFLNLSKMNVAAAVNMFFESQLQAVSPPLAHRRPEQKPPAKISPTPKSAAQGYPIQKAVATISPMQILDTNAGANLSDNDAQANPSPSIEAPRSPSSAPYCGRHEDQRADVANSPKIFPASSTLSVNKVVSVKEDTDVECPRSTSIGPKVETSSASAASIAENTCECGKSFSRPASLRRHKISHCKVCSSTLIFVVIDHNVNIAEYAHEIGVQMWRVEDKENVRSKDAASGKMASKRKRKGSVGLNETPFESPAESASLPFMNVTALKRSKHAEDPIRDSHVACQVVQVQGQPAPGDMDDSGLHPQIESNPNSIGEVKSLITHVIDDPRKVTSPPIAVATGEAPGSSTGPATTFQPTTTFTDIKSIDTQIKDCSSVSEAGICAVASNRANLPSLHPAKTIPCNSNATSSASKFSPSDPTNTTSTSFPLPPTPKHFSGINCTNDTLQTASSDDIDHSKNQALTTELIKKTLVRFLEKNCCHPFTLHALAQVAHC